MSLQELVSNYGYLAIGVGTFLEGETILVLGGLAAHRGFLQLPWVVACAFLGAFSGHQLYFHIGRAIKVRNCSRDDPLGKRSLRRYLLWRKNIKSG